MICDLVARERSQKPPPVPLHSFTKSIRCVSTDKPHGDDISNRIERRGEGSALDSDPQGGDALCTTAAAPPGRCDRVVVLAEYPLGRQEEDVHLLVVFEDDRRNGSALEHLCSGGNHQRASAFSLSRVEVSGQRILCDGPRGGLVVNAVVAVAIWVLDNGNIALRSEWYHARGSDRPAHGESKNKGQKELREHCRTVG